MRIKRSIATSIALQVTLLAVAFSMFAQQGGISQLPDKDEAFLKAVFPHDDLAKVKSLLAAGANVNAREKYTGRTGLFYAVSLGNKEMVRVLLDAGANVNARDDTGETALMSAYECTAEIVRMLVTGGTDVNARDNDGNTALVSGAVFDNVEVLQALIDAGAEVNASNKKGVTALMRAAKDRALRNVKALLVAGADINARDSVGWTALTFAEKNNDNKVVQVLGLFRRVKEVKLDRDEALSQINAIQRCSENPDELYNRQRVLEQLADTLNGSAPGYRKYRSRGFYVEDERPRGFFIYDLTDTLNKGSSLDCIDLKNKHVYHFAPHYIPYSFSHIVVLEDGNLKVFKSINCQNSNDRLEDVITYLNQRMSSDKNKDGVISRVKDYRKYGSFGTVDDTYIRCKEELKGAR